MATIPQKRILDLLKINGAMTAQQLATELNVTSMGARQLLIALRDKQLIIDYDQAEKVGRPCKYWKLTEQGHSSYPDRHNELTIQLIGSVKQLFGDDGLEDLIKAREKIMLKDYKTEISKCTTLKSKLERLVNIRSNEGYMATIQKDGKSYLLIENHCPICAAAKTCQNFCRSELDIFKKCLGRDYKVTREEHILDMATRCVYRVSPAD